MNLEFSGDMQKVCIKNDDTLIVKTDVVLSLKQINSLKEQIKLAFPNNKVVVLPCGIHLNVATIDSINKEKQP